MTLRERFQAFFAAANDGAEPYPWQVALAERIAATGTWPDAITAPTGSGKSSVVDIHVFLVAERQRQRLVGAPVIMRPPRRLVLVAPRRVLVDDQHARAMALAELLGSAGGDGPLAAVRRALESLVTTEELRSDGGGDRIEGPLGVARLRGGVRLDQTWRLDPARCQIVCATPQMWGSRLLMRGFRGSRRARNLDSGLLAHDVAVVVDEAHLHGRLVQSSRKASEMGSSAGAGRLQIVAMSATPAVAGGHSLGPKDLEDKRLARRVRAQKSVVVELVDEWGHRERASHIVRAAGRLRGEGATDGTVGVFVNTVAMALEVANGLKSGGATVGVVCGRMRPADLERLRRGFPGLLDKRGNRDVAFLVATQALEVGVDLDLGAMVSEVASASALAQRAGRLNRSGCREQSTLVVVAPRALAEADLEAKASFAPYGAAVVGKALEWLDDLAGDASPERISGRPLPVTPTPSLPDITIVELETLAMTSIDLVADPDVGFYVEDPVDSVERTVYIGARDLHGLTDAVVRAALEAAPPRGHELARMRRGRALDRMLAGCPVIWAIRAGLDGTPAPLRIAPDGILNDDVLVLEAGSRVAISGVIGAPDGSGEPLDDVMGERIDGGAPDVIVRLTGGLALEVAALVAGDPILGTRMSRRGLSDIVKRAGHVELANRLLRHQRLSDLGVTWCGDAEEPDAIGVLVVVASEREGFRPERAVSASRVTVDDHCEAVARRMTAVVDALDGLVDTEAGELVTAARLHDEGKRHPEFQRRMGALSGEVLAKPAPGHRPDRGDGWRHEQLSAGMAHARLRNPLVTVLVAGHHGNGRPLFNRDEVEALAGWTDCDDADQAALKELFGAYGRFELDRARLQREHGVHRLAFLEALVRCADMQVSREML